MQICTTADVVPGLHALGAPTRKPAISSRQPWKTRSDLSLWKAYQAAVGILMMLRKSATIAPN